MNYIPMILCFFMVFLVQNFNLTKQSTTNGYQIQKSKIYAGYATLTYCPKKCLQSWSCKVGQDYPKLVHVHYINNLITLAAGYLGYQPISQTIIISFRGSSNAQNWIQDYNTELQVFFGCKNCKIHTGFYTDYLLNSNKVDQGISNIRKQQQVKKIVVIGHSLGAALATIHGLHIAMKGIQIPLEVHNFGCPRIGNIYLAQFINQKIPQNYRVVHSHDIVPHAPDSKNYHHSATQIFFDEQMLKFKICDESGQDQSCSNQYNPDYNWGDHNNYFVQKMNSPVC